MQVPSPAGQRAGLRRRDGSEGCRSKKPVHRSQCREKSARRGFTCSFRVVIGCKSRHFLRHKQTFTFNNHYFNFFIHSSASVRRRCPGPFSRGWRQYGYAALFSGNTVKKNNSGICLLENLFNFVSCYMTGKINGIRKIRQAATPDGFAYAEPPAHDRRHQS